MSSRLQCVCSEFFPSEKKEFVVSRYINQKIAANCWLGYESGWVLSSRIGVCISGQRYDVLSNVLTDPKRE